MSKALLLMRHAKSDWDADYSGDHERPLNERGVRSAKLMGRLLAGMDLIPELVISSTAVRALTTAQLAAQAGQWPSSLRPDRALYDSGPDGVMSVAAGAPDVECLMLVGHQPTWSLLVSEIVGEPAEMKTASTAVIELDITSWAELGHTRGELRGLHHPKSYFGSEFDPG